MAILAQAPVAYAGLTSAAGTAEQIIQVNAAGVLAGLKAGNFLLNGPAPNEINGQPFKVTLCGTILAHGATQTVKVGLLAAAYSAAGVLGSLVDTFTTVASAALIAGTSYDFVIEQEFYASSLSQQLSGMAPLVSVGGANVSISVTAAGVPLTNMGSASQTEPINGVNNSVNQPAFAFAASITNSVSDTTESVTLSQFCISAA